MHIDILGQKLDSTLIYFYLYFIFQSQTTSQGHTFLEALGVAMNLVPHQYADATKASKLDVLLGLQGMLLEEGNDLGEQVFQFSNLPLSGILALIVYLSTSEVGFEGIEQLGIAIMLCY